MPDDLVPTWIEAIATCLGVLLALIAVILTLRQIRQTSSQLELNSQQMRDAAAREAEDSEARTRPYVGVDFVPGLAGNGSFDIVIQNFGTTVARDVRIALTEGPFASQSEGDEIGPALGRLFEKPFDLAPGARRRLFWRLDENSKASPSGAMGAPVAGEVAATYEWWRDGQRETRSYSESIRYDLSEYPKLIPRAGRGAEAQGAASDVVGKNAVHALRRIAEAVGEVMR